ncbi:hypothetical protein CDAR_536241 [Caerostris darwini]|uniref:Uncharacterized protein n=1 Tax=Caerostris darwini TaxID=1538125 RepID=A0AAV4S6U3_9ARAC|nr:hypothetical protein CDAR_536241 [Caerostris darwini]
MLPQKRSKSYRFPQMRMVYGYGCRYLAESIPIKDENVIIGSSPISFFIAHRTVNPLCRNQIMQIGVLQGENFRLQRFAYIITAATPVKYKCRYQAESIPIKNENVIIGGSPISFFIHRRMVNPLCCNQIMQIGELQAENFRLQRFAYIITSKSPLKYK